jgi:Ca-activated chloride channel family protein
LTRAAVLARAELNTTKIDVAKEVLTGILGLLGPNDSVSIVLFSDGACTPVPLTPVTCLDLPAIDAQVDTRAASPVPGSRLPLHRGLG